MCIIAGDISPIDVITPLPVLCEDNDVPYVYVPSKEVRHNTATITRNSISMCCTEQCHPYVDAESVLESYFA